MPARMRLVTTLLSAVLSAAVVAAVLPEWYEVKGGTWVVDDATVTAMKQDIQSAVRALAGSRSERFPPWTDYTFQYQGQGSEASTYVLVNAFCNSWGLKDLTASFVMVKDGGECYFKVRYDPRTHKFLNLLVNGSA